MPRNSSTKNDLLKAATTLFAEKGPDGTSVDEIVAKARCNKRMVYHYFGDKEGLIAAVLTETYQKISAFEQKTLSLDNSSDPKKLLKIILVEQTRFLSENPQVVSILMWENLSKGRHTKKLALKGTKKTFFQALQERLGKYKKGSISGNIPQLFITLTAVSYFTFSNRFTLKNILGFDPASKENLKKRTTHLLKLFDCE